MDQIPRATVFGGGAFIVIVLCQPRLQIGGRPGVETACRLASKNIDEVHDNMARPEGFEPPTLCLEGRRSFQLSYGRFVDSKTFAARETTFCYVFTPYCARTAPKLDPLEPQQRKPLVGACARHA